MSEGLAVIIGRGQDLMNVRSCLKTAKDVHQGSFDWVVSRSGALTPSLQITITLVSVEGGEERLQRREELRISLCMNT